LLAPGDADADGVLARLALDQPASFKERITARLVRGAVARAVRGARTA
jgi:hypothetical protein